MKKAKVKFHILMEYETTIEERQEKDWGEDSMNLIDTILHEADNLKCYREDLHSALSDSKLVNVTVQETENYETEDYINNFSI